MLTKPTMPGLGPTLLLTLLIAACGGNGGDHVMPADLSGANNAAEPMVAPDSFINAVSAVSATSSDVDDPVAVDDSAPSRPDTTAPVPLG